MLCFLASEMVPRLGRIVLEVQMGPCDMKERSASAKNAKLSVPRCLNVQTSVRHTKSRGNPPHSPVILRDPRQSPPVFSPRNEICRFLGSGCFGFFGFLGFLRMGLQSAGGLIVHTHTASKLTRHALEELSVTRCAIHAPRVKNVYRSPLQSRDSERPRPACMVCEWRSRERSLTSTS
ncbi:hypothetical protein K474DRAFT_869482 [Panus rudis PR-1116 ss-1]|nr:hypothetical protein K474DRAFT_869482 [Panus rudis PR-1116 ss-1]